MNKDKGQTLEQLCYRRLRLIRDYRIINSSYDFCGGKIPYLKHQCYLKQIENFLSHCDGGALLVTGLRGVGKSSVVNNAINELNNIGKCKLLPITVFIPTEKTYSQLLKEIIRKLYEMLIQNSVWDYLQEATKQRIRLAYDRTRVDIKQSNSSILELEGTLKIPSKKLPSIKGKMDRQKAEERSFLTFEEEDLEYELSQCIDAIGNDDSDKHIVVVLDEIDKITATSAGTACFEKLLEQMKNLISSSKALFIFIAGIDIYKRWEEDIKKLNSLYDSLFDQHIYLPCIWDSVEELFHVIADDEYVYMPVEDSFKHMVMQGQTSILNESFRMIADYILFKGKGLPRRILHAFNEFISWETDPPCFQLSEEQIQAIRQISHLLIKFKTYTTTYKPVSLFERDIHYSLFLSMLDFILSNEKKVFFKEEIRKELLDAGGFLEVWFKNITDNMFIEFEKLAFIHSTNELEYEVKDDTVLKRDTPRKISEQNHLTITEQGKETMPTSVNVLFHSLIMLSASSRLNSFWKDYNADKILVRAEKMSIFRVKKGSEQQYKYAVLYNYNNEIAADKKCINNIYSLGEYRFEGSFLIDEADYLKFGKPVIALKTPIKGYALSDLIESKIKRKVIFSTIYQVLSMLEYFHSLGFGNIRISPENIILCPDGTIKILDLTNLTKFGMNEKFNTVRIYSAPEVYLHKCSPESDFYSVGILLIELLCGKRFYKISNDRHINIDTALSDVKVSKKLVNLILKITAFDPGERYKNVNEILVALEVCPEFWKCSLIKFKQNGIVVGIDISKDISEDFIKSEIGVPEGKKDTTGLLHNSYFINEQNSANSKKDSEFLSDDKPYLVRVINNERIVIDKPLFILGKRENKEKIDYSIENNQYISKIHAIIEKRDKKIYIMDAGSPNGTYKNSVKLSPRCSYELSNGDNILLATEEFIFYC